MATQSPTALSIKEGSDDHSKGEETLLEEEDSEDLEVFRPTDKWQTLKPGVFIPMLTVVSLNKLMINRSIPYLSNSI